MASKLLVTLKKSTVGTNPSARGTVRALGLRRIGQTVELPDDPAVRGQIRAVRYLVDPAGGNNPLSTFRDLFLELKGGTPCYVGGVCPEFRTAYDARMGTSLADYEARFFEIIRAYLN